ncbi:MAG: hypothetical protein SGI83_18340 [Bacteroidota bacterium]|nr:hypothetical protein [Bacteroidota bacterium]
MKIIKRQIIAAGLVLFALTAKAQPPQGPPKPPSIEERLKKTNEVVQAEVQLSVKQKTAVETAFKIFFAAEDKLRKDNPPPPSPPPDPRMKEATDKLVKERDEQVKKVLTDEEYKKYKEAAKKLHPPKPPGQNETPRQN